ncbi:hypothetical protein J7E93_00560 [Streptomyces sp. ISL-36]|uniref:hypothetical protein n=1 Tax=Streptomyces sp. ISL-36 TaxID=2819182 RepID=UPI001BE920C3|nr:hypothetical protein [Streptomyces sp. ISL-36]MBT2438642.1 hypothetical protein [Streptomyces sp. ISL-36]
MYEAKDAQGKRLHTVAEIASAFNVTRGTIYRALEKTDKAPIPAQLSPCPTAPCSPAPYPTAISRA